jgi:hypothetical protein
VQTITDITYWNEYTIAIHEKDINWLESEPGKGFAFYFTIPFQDRGR